MGTNQTTQIESNRSRTASIHRQRPAKQITDGRVVGDEAGNVQSIDCISSHRLQRLERIARREPSPLQKPGDLRAHLLVTYRDRRDIESGSECTGRPLDPVHIERVKGRLGSFTIDTPLPQLGTNGQWPTPLAGHLLCKRAGIAPIVDIVGIAKSTKGSVDDLFVEPPLAELSRQFRRGVITVAEKTDCCCVGSVSLRLRVRR